MGIMPMQWGLLVPEVCEAINAIAEKAGCDPVYLTAMALGAAIVGDPGRMPVAVRAFDTYAFDFHSRVPFDRTGPEDREKDENADVA
jgi:hypothetical protein